MQRHLSYLSAATLMAALCLTSACGALTKNELAQLDADTSVSHDALGPNSPGCPPDEGNERGVGAPCSKGGGECRGTAAPYCSVDASNHAPVAFCTKPCFNSNQCGNGATCTPDPQAPILKACVPNICL